MQRADPRLLVSFDLEPVSEERLLEEARHNGHALLALSEVYVAGDRLLERWR